MSGEVHPRVLALFEIAETDDLGTALLSLFAPQSGYRDRVRSGRCFVRFAAVADPAQRQVAARALREWLHNTEPISRLETMPQTTSASASDQTTEDEDTTKERTTAA